MNTEVVTALSIILFGYLAGSLSPSYWITKIMTGEDIRITGSHHATTTNTIRRVGWLPGIVVFLLDLLKGYIPTYLALEFSSFGWVVPVAASLAVAGHCWPLYHQFKGGMGLATSAGGMAAVYPLGLLVTMGFLIIVMLVIKHSARAAFITGIFAGLIFWILGQRGNALWLALGVGAVIAVRFLSDWGRKYSELWLDRKHD